MNTRRRDPTTGFPPSSHRSLPRPLTPESQCRPWRLASVLGLLLLSCASDSGVTPKGEDTPVPGEQGVLAGAGGNTMLDNQAGTPPASGGAAEQSAQPEEPIQNQGGQNQGGQNQGGLGTAGTGEEPQQMPTGGASEPIGAGAPSAGAAGEPDPDSGSPVPVETDAGEEPVTLPIRDGRPEMPAVGGWPAPPLGGKKFVGNITARSRIPEGFFDLWDQLTPENEGKWESVERTKDRMNWDTMDAHYRQTQENGALFKLHTFVWGSQQPGWVDGDGDVRGQVEEWMRLSCERFPNADLIDVVNEPPPHTDPAAVVRALGGAGSSGYDWVVEAFHMARELCPNAILIFNDYNNIEWDTDQENFIRIATAVKDAGAPVDALGAQAHDAYLKTSEELRGRIDRLASVGLPLYISEYDINVANDDEQQRIMAEQFPIFWNDDRIRGITLWGYIYGQTWRANTGLVRDGQPRPAMTWLMDFLTTERAL